MTASSHVIKAKNVHIGVNKNKLLLVLYSSKTHGKADHPQKIKIEANESCYQECFQKKHFFCPFQMSHCFLKLHGGYTDDGEQFFVFQDDSPVKKPFNLVLYSKKQ